MSLIKHCKQYLINERSILGTSQHQSPRRGKAGLQRPDNVKLVLGENNRQHAESSLEQ